MTDLQPAAPELAAGLDDAREIVAQTLAGVGLAHRRSVPLTASPVANAVPQWANGMASSQSLGPFKDLAGRDVWIDLFPIVRQVSLVRTPGGVPFMKLPIETSLLPFPPPPTPTLDVPGGSVWFASQLLDSTAPASSWTGIQVAGGTLSFSGPVTGTADEIVVPFAVTTHVTVHTAAQAAATGTGPGQDARDASVAVPGQFHLTIGTTAELTIDPADTARVLAFGFDTTLAPTNGPVAYNAALNLLAVPLSAQTTPFTVNSVKASAFSLAGTAPIGAAAWGLPVAVIDPANLGTASGTGSLILNLGAGLTGTWLGQPTPIRLMSADLVATPLSLAVVSTDAQGDRVELQPQLPATEHGHLDLRWTTTSPVVFVSEAAGAEAVATTAMLSAALDRPVDLRGEQLSLGAPSISVLLLATAQGTFLLIDGQLVSPFEHAIGFALVNALLRVAPPSTLVLYGAFDGTTLSPAVVLLEYRLLAVVPTLPDPYAASYGSIVEALRQRDGLIASILAWGPKSSSFDFVVLQQQGEGLLVLGRARQNPFLAAQAPTALGERGSPDLWADAATAGGGSLAFEGGSGLIMVDVSTNVDQFGVAWETSARKAAYTASFAIQNLTLEAGGQNVLLLTLPAVQWEAVETVQDPEPNPLPQWVDFANSGVPTVVTVPTANLVPVHPAAALNVLVDNFAQEAPLPALARFTLPFGIVALAGLHAAVPGGSSRSASVTVNRPATATLKGAHQLRIDAHDASLASGQTPAFDGFTVQLPVAQPGNRSVLGDDVTSIFNSYLGTSGKRPMVPVTRMDLSGYGESLFSDWHNPYSDPVAVAQARFDVLTGRTAVEIVQVRSILFPYGVVVVRTITIERRNNAIVTRSDSGWRAISDGVYEFPASTIVTHPGVVTRITGVVNILDTGQVINVSGTDMAAVYFDGDLALDGAPTNPDGSTRLAPAKGQFGFIQITADSLISPSQYSDLLAQAGTLGGPVDTDINVGSGPQVMHLQRVGVGVTQGMGGPEFVMTGWGAPAFPGGQWSAVQINSPTSAPTAVAQDSGLPLIRAGAAGTAPSPTSPYRFADPADLAQPTNPSRDYAVLHAMGTQRALFPRPKIEATDPTAITSTQIGSVADPYSMGTAIGPYPSPDKTVPFPTAAWSLAVDPHGQYTLNLPSPFAAGVGRRTMRQAGSVRSDLDYSSAQVTYAVATAQPVSWRFRLDKAVKIMNTTSLGDVIQLRANVVSTAGVATQFQQPNLMLGGSLTIVQDLLSILADFGITESMSALMTNDWALKVAGIVPVVDANGDPLQIPPQPDPNPDIIFDDTQIKVEINVAPTADQATFSMGGAPMLAIHQIPGLYAVAIIKFQIQISTSDGTVYSLLIGVGLAYKLGSIGPFEFKGLIAVTIFGFIGDTALGFGIGFLLQLQASIDPIVQVTISLEGQLAIVMACHGTPSATTYGAAKLTFGVEVSVCLVFSISIEVSTTASEVISGPGGPACALPDVLPNAS